MDNLYHRENKMKQLANETVRLRALEPEDLDLLYRWENNPELWKLGNTMSPYSRYILKEYIQDSHRDIYEMRQLRLMIELCATGKAVGTVDLFDFDPHHRRVALGLLIDPEYQNKGLGRSTMQLVEDYVFTFLKLHQLYVHIPADNIPCKTLFNHLGYALSGTLKDWLVTENGYTDVLVMQKMNSHLC